MADAYEIVEHSYDVAIVGGVGLRAALGMAASGLDCGKHSRALSWLDNNERVRLDWRPVHLQPYSNEMSTIPPKECVY